MKEQPKKKKPAHKKDGEQPDITRYRDNPGAATGGLMFTKAEILDITKGVDSDP